MACKHLFVFDQLLYFRFAPAVMFTATAGVTFKHIDVRVFNRSPVLFNQFESRVEELAKELRDAKDKLVHQDQAAKNAIQQMQRDMACRLEQVRGHHCGNSPPCF